MKKSIFSKTFIWVFSSVVAFIMVATGATAMWVNLAFKPKDIVEANTPTRDNWVTRSSYPVSHSFTPGYEDGVSISANVTSDKTVSLNSINGECVRTDGSFLGLGKDTYSIDTVALKFNRDPEPGELFTVKISGHGTDITRHFDKDYRKIDGYYTFTVERTEWFKKDSTSSLAGALFGIPFSMIVIGNALNDGTVSDGKQLSYNIDIETSSFTVSFDSGTNRLNSRAEHNGIKMIEFYTPDGNTQITRTGAAGESDVPQRSLNQRRILRNFNGGGTYVQMIVHLEEWAKGIGKDDLADRVIRSEAGIHDQIEVELPGGNVFPVNPSDTDVIRTLAIRIPEDAFDGHDGHLNLRFRQIVYPLAISAGRGITVQAPTGVTNNVATTTASTVYKLKEPGAGTEIKLKVGADYKTRYGGNTAVLLNKITVTGAGATKPTTGTWDAANEVFTFKLATVPGTANPANVTVTIADLDYDTRHSTPLGAGVSSITSDIIGNIATYTINLDSTRQFMSNSLLSDYITVRNSSNTVMAKTVGSVNRTTRTVTVTGVSSAITLTVADLPYQMKLPTVGNAGFISDNAQNTGIKDLKITSITGVQGQSTDFDGNSIYWVNHGKTATFNIELSDTHYGYITGTTSQATIANGDSFDDLIPIPQRKGTSSSSANYAFKVSTTSADHDNLVSSFNVEVNNINGEVTFNIVPPSTAVASTYTVSITNNDTTAIDDVYVYKYSSGPTSFTTTPPASKNLYGLFYDVRSSYTLVVVKLKSSWSDYANVKSDTKLMNYITYEQTGRNGGASFTEHFSPFGRNQGKNDRDFAGGGASAITNDVSVPRGNEYFTFVVRGYNGNLKINIGSGNGTIPQNALKVGAPTSIPALKGETNHGITKNYIIYESIIDNVKDDANKYTHQTLWTVNTERENIDGISTITSSTAEFPHGGSAIIEIRLKPDYVGSPLKLEAPGKITDTNIRDITRPKITECNDCKKTANDWCNVCTYGESTGLLNGVFRFAIRNVTQSILGPDWVLVGIEPQQVTIANPKIFGNNGGRELIDRNGTFGLDDDPVKVQYFGVRNSFSSGKWVQVITPGQKGGLKIRVIMNSNYSQTIPLITYTMDGDTKTISGEPAINLAFTYDFVIDPVEKSITEVIIGDKEFEKNSYKIQYAFIGKEKDVDITLIDQFGSFECTKEEENKCTDVETCTHQASNKANGIYVPKFMTKRQLEIALGGGEDAPAISGLIEKYIPGEPFDEDGNSIFENGEEKGIILPTLTMAGYTFENWRIDPDEFTASIFLKDGIVNDYTFLNAVFMPIHEYITLYVEWEFQKWDIEYFYNDGDNIVPCNYVGSDITYLARPDVHVLSRETILPNGRNMIRPGYAFMGWYLNDETMTDGFIQKSISKGGLENLIIPEAVYEGTEIKLYGKWEKLNATVEFRYPAVYNNDPAKANTIIPDIKFPFTYGEKVEWSNISVLDVEGLEFTQGYSFGGYKVSYDGNIRNFIPSFTWYVDGKTDPDDNYFVLGGLNILTGYDEYRKTYLTASMISGAWPYQKTLFAEEGGIEFIPQTIYLHIVEKQNQYKIEFVGTTIEPGTYFYREMSGSVFRTMNLNSIVPSLSGNDGFAGWYTKPCANGLLNCGIDCVTDECGVRITSISSDSLPTGTVKDINGNDVGGIRAVSNGHEVRLTGEPYCADHNDCQDGCVTIDDTIRLYPRYELWEKPVTYYSGYNDDKFELGNKKLNDLIDMLPNQFVRPGWTFTGWMVNGWQGHLEGSGKLWSYRDRNDRAINQGEEFGWNAVGVVSPSSVRDLVYGQANQFDSIALTAQWEPNQVWIDYSKFDSSGRIVPNNTLEAMNSDDLYTIRKFGGDEVLTLNLKNRANMYTVKGEAQIGWAIYFGDAATGLELLFEEYPTDNMTMIELVAMLASKGITWNASSTMTIELRAIYTTNTYTITVDDLAKTMPGNTSDYVQYTAGESYTYNDNAIVRINAKSGFDFVSLHDASGVEITDIVGYYVGSITPANLLVGNLESAIASFDASGEFTGWTVTVNNGGIRDTKSGSELHVIIRAQALQPIYDNNREIQLLAKFKAKAYEVTFVDWVNDTNTNGTPMNSAEVSWPSVWDGLDETNHKLSFNFDKGAVALPEPSKLGNAANPIFGGWFYYDEEMELFFPVRKNDRGQQFINSADYMGGVKLYAKWRASNIRTITYYYGVAQSLSVTNNNITSYNINELHALAQLDEPELDPRYAKYTLNSPVTTTSPDYTFIGWADITNGFNPSYISNGYYDKRTPIQSGDFHFDFHNDEGDYEDKIFYAIWDAVLYPKTFTDYISNNSVTRQYGASDRLPRHETEVVTREIETVYVSNESGGFDEHYVYKTRVVYPAPELNTYYGNINNSSLGSGVLNNMHDYGYVAQMPLVSGRNDDVVTQARAFIPANESNPNVTSWAIGGGYLRINDRLDFNNYYAVWEINTLPLDNLLTVLGVVYTKNKPNLETAINQANSFLDGIRNRDLEIFQNASAKSILEGDFAEMINRINAIANALAEYGITDLRENISSGDVDTITAEAKKYYYILDEYLREHERLQHSTVVGKFELASRTATSFSTVRDNLKPFVIDDVAMNPTTLSDIVDSAKDVIERTTWTNFTGDPLEGFNMYSEIKSQFERFVSIIHQYDNTKLVSELASVNSKKSWEIRQIVDEFMRNANGAYGEENGFFEERPKYAQDWTRWTWPVSGAAQTEEILSVMEKAYLVHEYRVTQGETVNANEVLDYGTLVAIQRATNAITGVDLFKAEQDLHRSFKNAYGFDDIDFATLGSANAADNLKARVTNMKNVFDTYSIDTHGVLIKSNEIKTMFANWYALPEITNIDARMKLLRGGLLMSTVNEMVAANPSLVETFANIKPVFEINYRFTFEGAHITYPRGIVDGNPARMFASQELERHVEHIMIILQNWGTNLSNSLETAMNNINTDINPTNGVRITVGEALNHIVVVRALINQGGTVLTWNANELKPHEKNGGVNKNLLERLRTLIGIVQDDINFMYENHEITYSEWENVMGNILMNARHVADSQSPSDTELQRQINILEQWRQAYGQEPGSGPIRDATEEHYQLALIIRILLEYDMSKYPGMESDIIVADKLVYEELSLKQELQFYIDKLLRYICPDYDPSRSTNPGLEKSNGVVGHQDNQGKWFPLPVDGWDKEFLKLQVLIADVDKFIAEGGLTQEQIAELKASVEYRNAVYTFDFARIAPKASTPVQNLWDARIQLEELMKNYPAFIPTPPEIIDGGKKNAWEQVIIWILVALIVIAIITATIFIVRMQKAKQQKTYKPDNVESNDMEKTSIPIATPTISKKEARDVLFPKKTTEPEKINLDGNPETEN